MLAEPTLDVTGTRRTGCWRSASQWWHVVALLGSPFGFLFLFFFWCEICGDGFRTVARVVLVVAGCCHGCVE
ncbi:putative formin-like protein 5 [Iris pallida]|uniref:Formin-like protein 5 n=1 Tax=Iris pallida TaxID=29817 RepID=A0AAX6GXI4_IRIPA|nr:putative formin-like protein 5 [Iris pallida]KAJ6833252.1 putative formin-like protein 5 [Iris pallida]